MSFKVLVIGGGNCGLALAQGLRKHGIDYAVYERDSADEYHNRPRDWGALLHWGQDYIRQCLPDDIWERRTEMWVDPFHDYENSSASFLWDAKTGAELTQLPARVGTVRVSSRKVRVLLSQGLKIEFGKKLKSLEEDSGEMVAWFEDGTSARGSMVVGCDGGKSKVREFVVGKDAARGFDTDYTLINTWARLPRETAKALRQKHPIISLAFHPDLQAMGMIAILDVPTKDASPEEWKFQILSGWKGEPRKVDLERSEKAMQHFKAAFKQIAEPFHSVGEAFPEDHILPVDDGWNFKPAGDFEWNNHGGKVTLAGDAAHSMLPHRGQALNNAIMDAAMVVQAIKKARENQRDLADTIQEYEDEMRPRGSREVDMTLEVMHSLQRRDFATSPLFRFGFKKPQGDGAAKVI